jgi:hypothetical protein
MAAIKPFRYLIVYPALMRSIERYWQTNASPDSTATSLNPSRAGAARAAGADQRPAPRARTADQRVDAR